jgi:hypothetical protein
MDLEAGDERADGRQRAGKLDGGRIEADLLLGLPQGRRRERLAGVVAPPAGEGDLAGMAAEVGAALGEDEAGLLRVVVYREQNRRLGAAGRGQLLRLVGTEQAIFEVAARVGVQARTATTSR